jgi:hypothetical protein
MAQPEEPTIDEWVQFFVATRHRDLDVSTAAYAWIDERIQVAPAILLDMACTIIPDESQPLVARRMASFAAVHALRPKNAHHLAEIRNGWHRSPALAAYVKEWIYRTVLCEDEVLRGQAALAFALVLGIEGEAWANGLLQIHQVLAQSSDSPVQATSLLLIFKEILNLPHFPELKAPSLMEGYTSLLDDALTIVSFEGDIHPLLRFTATECVRDALEVLPEICMDDQNRPNVEQVRFVL